MVPAPFLFFAATTTAFHFLVSCPSRTPSTTACSCAQLVTSITPPVSSFLQFSSLNPQRRTPAVTGTKSCCCCCCHDRRRCGVLLLLSSSSSSSSSSASPSRREDSTEKDPIEEYDDATHSQNVTTSLHEMDKDKQKEGNEDEEEEDAHFLRREMEHLESLEEIMNGMDGPSSLWDDDFELWDQGSLDEILGDFVPSVDIDDEDSYLQERVESIQERAARGLEEALLSGVVPVSAGVGSDALPGDFGFDPFHLASKDLFQPTQQFLLNLLPQSRWEKLEQDNANNNNNNNKNNHHNPDMELWINRSSAPRPKALILRDYREAEIRHGRLAMLAAIIWPLQEMLDRFVLSKDQFAPLIYGPVTLPYFPLLMTAILLLLGYLDIYSQAIKDMDRIGEAFLPGDCFWDPLAILQGTTDRTKRNMQERELFNGRAAMLAVAAYTLEESVTHTPFVDLESNAILLQPPFAVPFIQQWLDGLF